MSLAERTIEAFQKLTPEQLARFVAFLVAPTLVLVLAASDFTRAGLAVELERPLAISKLKTRLAAEESHGQVEGLVLLLEPSAQLDFRIPLKAVPQVQEVWTSMDAQSAAANRDRLFLDPSGLVGEAPLLGVSEPVAVVVSGSPEGEVQLAGGADDLERWRLASRRSVALVGSVLVSCVFGLGVSMTLAFPRKRTRTQTVR